MRGREWVPLLSDPTLPVPGHGIAGEKVTKNKCFRCPGRQKYLLSNPAHQSGAVDEHFFLNESLAQVREISKFKPLSTQISLSVITGDCFDEHLPTHLNQVFAERQSRALARIYPQASRIHIPGADRRVVYKKPSSVSKHLLELVSKRQTKQLRQ